MYDQIEQQTTARTIPLAELNYLAAARAAEEVLSRVSSAASPTTHPGQADDGSLDLPDGSEPAPPSSPPPEGAVSDYLDYGQLQGPETYLDYEQLQVPPTYIDWHKARMPTNWTSLEPHQLPFFPSPAAPDLPFLGFHHQSHKALASISDCGPSDVANEALFKLYRFHGQLTLAKLKLNIKSEDDKAAWRKCLAVSLRVQLGHTIFPCMPRTIDRASADRDAQVNWIIDTALNSDTDETLKDVRNGHEELQAFLSLLAWLPSPPTSQSRPIAKVYMPMAPRSPWVRERRR